MYNLHEFYMFVDIDRILISKEYSFLHYLLIYVHSDYNGARLRIIVRKLDIQLQSITDFVYDSL